MRLAQALGVAAASILLATPAPVPPPPERGGPAVARLFAEPVPLNPNAPDERRLGPLLYLGGWELSSDDRRFGAISALAFDGDRFAALSDQGILFRFGPPGGDGRVAILPIAAGPGNPASKVDRDSESMALTGDQLWIGYENSNEIWRYRSSDLSASSRAAPTSMEGWSANRGAESLLRLPDGRFFLVREDVDDEGVSEALLFLADPAQPGAPAVPLRIDPPQGHRVTDAAALSDGRLLLLTRGFGLWSGWTARLLVAELPAGAGQLMPAREVAALEAPLTRDNMEAITVSEEGGRTIVWLASDDNLITLQCTLLLKFEWVGEGTSPRT